MSKLSDRHTIYLQRSLQTYQDATGQCMLPFFGQLSLSEASSIIGLETLPSGLAIMLQGLRVLLLV